jgi:hypothetical protein
MFASEVRGRNLKRKAIFGLSSVHKAAVFAPLDRNFAKADYISC